MGCLDEDEIFAFLAGDLSGAKRERVEVHVDDCADCRGLLAEAARGEPEVRGVAIGSDDTLVDTGDRPTTGHSDYPSAGTRIDRYTVDRFLGAGGMGVVLLARDPELDRQVTIKLLRPELADPDDTRGARARLLREAQAMARLSHPNVVPIYDIGTWNDRVFIAMEYLDGGTLANRLAGELAADEVIALFAAAGRGLAAAHAARLIHRDFKPANVMLSKSGAVKVTDFGLALPGAAAANLRRRSAEIAVPDTDSSSSLTRTGMIVGTPAYMAPEQMQGAAVDVRSDIFSFCVALHEGLYGSRPFHGATTTELLEATLEQRLAPPAREPKLPERVRAMLARGLEADPAKRPRSMAEVLAALAPRRVRWPLIAGAAAVLAATALIAAGIGWLRAADEPLDLVATTCSNGPARLAPSWNDEIAVAVSRAIRDSGIRAPEVLARELRRKLDSYRDQWVSVHRASCTATRLAGEQSFAVMEKQMACLERRRGELDRAVDLLEAITPKSAGLAESMVTNLTSPEVCASVESMAREPPQPADPETELEVLRVRAAISEAHAAAVNGSVDRARAAIVEAAERAREIGFAPVEAEAWLTRGQIEHLGSRFDDALASFREAIQVARLGNHNKVVADAYIEIIDLQIRRARLDEAERTLRYARDALSKIGESLDTEAALASRAARIHQARGQVDEAIAEARRGVELRRKLHGARAPEVAEALLDLASIYNLGANRQAEAIPLLREAVAMYEALYGPDDPRLVPGLTTLASALSLAGKHAEALAMLDRREAILERVLGADNPRLVQLRADRAGYLARAGRHDQAEALLDTLVTSSAEVSGVGSREHIDGLMIRGSQHYLGGRLDQAVRDMVLALEYADKLYGPTSQTALIYRNLLGTALTRAGKLAEAEAELQTNVANGKKTLAGDAPLLADALARLAKVERLRGHPARAARRLEGVLAMLARQPEPAIEAFARWQLGQALDSGARAVEMVETARAFYASARGDREILAEIDAWLASR